MLNEESFDGDQKMDGVQSKTCEECGASFKKLAYQSDVVFLGVDPLQAGNVVGLVIVLGLTLVWVPTYIFRVSNKEMTYAQQLRDYENKVMEKQLEGLTEAKWKYCLNRLKKRRDVWQVLAWKSSTEQMNGLYSNIKGIRNGNFIVNKIKSGGRRGKANDGGEWWWKRTDGGDGGRGQTAVVVEEDRLVVVEEVLLV
ncbi:hypothetical protein Pint_24918 [Pistacia integerrima]|uniref:Uncharacterized protein n=1 Tax=Pistacia integerrima TaxID=434235 RepID=A0ACC0YCP5_9ROSI|nr:hypothetical protein Pint_24918 [Pistacia integerrima]